jgi:hypothetical protein
LRVVSNTSLDFLVSPIGEDKVATGAGCRCQKFDGMTECTRKPPTSIIPDIWKRWIEVAQLFDPARKRAAKTAAL